MASEPVPRICRAKLPPDWLRYHWLPAPPPLAGLAAGAGAGFAAAVVAGLLAAGLAGAGAGAGLLAGALATGAAGAGVCAGVGLPQARSVRSAPAAPDASA